MNKQKLGRPEEETQKDQEMIVSAKPSFYCPAVKLPVGRTGRITLPTKIRSLLKPGDSVVVILMDQGRLAIFPAETAHRLIQNLLNEQQLPISDPERSWIGSSYCTTLSLQQGLRIKIADFLRKGIRKVILLGCGDYAEVWEVEQWEKYLSTREMEDWTPSYDSFTGLLEKKRWQLFLKPSKESISSIP